MEAHTIKITKTAHFYTLGQAGSHIKHFWLVCHGYGQAANKFIYKFDDLVDEETLIVAPEALSRFYFGGFTGNVGASWMTKADREDEIQDYLQYLQQIYDHFVPQLAPDVRITFLGFSQGGATIARFALLKKPLFHHFINWASDFAHDLDFLGNQAFLANKKMYWVIGDEDEFLTEERVKKFIKFADDQKINYELVNFNGKHIIDRKVLGKLAKQLTK